MWHEPWDELHHQGDVGEASYTSVPHLVRIHRTEVPDAWNTYAIVATIELARGKGSNPKAPVWLEEDYLRTIQELAKISITEISHTEEPDAVRAILGVIAIAKGLRTHGKFLVEYSENEMLNFESRI